MPHRAQTSERTEGRYALRDVSQRRSRSKIGKIPQFSAIGAAKSALHPLQTNMLWQTSRFNIDLSAPKVMGIVNITPDSFSDGGLHASTANALKHCEKLLRDGADILDIGGESSRPGALAVAAQDELSRIVPVVTEAVKMGVPISVDTYKPEVMQVVLDLGADIINDIFALGWDPESDGTAVDPAADPHRVTESMKTVAAHPTCGVCLMHMHGNPQTMKLNRMDGDVVQQILAFWQSRLAALDAIGLARSRVVLDPGVGFGKTVSQNFELLRRQKDLLAQGLPLLIGWSRKSSLATATSTSLATLATLDARDRMVPSVAAALLAAERGASIVRVHDVRETAQALRVLAAIK